MSFEELNVQPEIVRALKEEDIFNPTVIQEKAIPLIKAGKDVIGMSRTGSGKTVAFSVPLLEKIKPRQGVQALVIAPTRELAVQISKEFEKFGRYLKYKVATVYGGVSLEPQIHRITQSEIVVGTPGRLLDHLRRNTLNLSRLTCVVLDEADKMVEMGFIEDVRQLLDCTPKGRQVLLFGATLSGEIEQLKREYMTNPATAEAELHVEKDLLEQYYYDLQPHEKFSMLVHLLKKEKPERSIIFCSTRSTVEIIASNLRTQGIKNDMIHGRLTQNRRLRVIEGFNRGYSSVLVASAVAARGLHIDGVTHIFNYDLSQDPQEYIHRVGRTARAGANGKAFTLLSSKDYGAFSGVLERYRIEVKELPREHFERVPFQARRFSRDPIGSSVRRGLSRHERYERQNNGYAHRPERRAFSRNAY